MQTERRAEPLLRTLQCSTFISTEVAYTMIKFHKHNCCHELRNNIQLQDSPFTIHCTHNKYERCRISLHYPTSANETNKVTICKLSFKP